MRACGWVCAYRGISTQGDGPTRRGDRVGGVLRVRVLSCCVVEGGAVTPCPAVTHWWGDKVQAAHGGDVGGVFERAAFWV